MKSYPLLIGLILSISSVSKAAELAELTFSNLKESVVENKITKLDDLFSILPKAMKQNSILVYRSQALNPHAATFMNPRMILSNQDASLIMTVAHNPGETLIEKGKDVLEIVTFNAESKKFEMYIESFNGKDLPFTKLNKNPAKCTACHGADPRPLFHDYNGWPGTYGSFGTLGVAATGSVEYNGLKTFLSKAKEMPRYKELDLSGFRGFPISDKIDKATGEIKLKAGTAGISYGIQNTESLFKVDLEKYGFAPQIVLGMSIEGLVHQKLAAKISRFANFESEILPLMYYLGEAPSEMDAYKGVVSGRCGHPNEKTSTIYSKLIELNSNNQMILESAINNIEQQVKIDAKIRALAVRKSNILAKEIDPRGIASIPWTAYFPTEVNHSPDQVSFKKQTALIEVLFQKLGLISSDISTSRETPTTGIFHLSRLGRMAVDEQYFQNFMQGLKKVLPAQIAEYDTLSCEELKSKALDSAANIFGSSQITLKAPGIIYHKIVKK